MKKIKWVGLSLFLALSALMLSFSPIKAQGYSADDYMYNGDYMISGNYNYPYYYSNNRSIDFYRNRFRIPFRSAITYPRTVYLVDASNSANQLNIINATRGGSTIAAYITVRPEVYDRVVGDYNQLGMVSVRVNQFSRLVTFQTVNGTYSTYAMNISWQ
jgi:hypothetical protein